MTKKIPTPEIVAADSRSLPSTEIYSPEDVILSGEKTIPTQGDNMPAYYAKPKNAMGQLPIVMVIQEIFGVNEPLRSLCHRLAQQGYLAIAPDLYFRHGNSQDYPDIASLLSGLVAKVPDAQVLADLDHVASWASRHGGDAHRLMVTGFGWGGRVAWLYAAHNPQLKAAVAWYGELVSRQTLNSPHQPIDIATELNAPVLGLYGEWDTHTPPAGIEMMRQALRAANVTAEIIVYPQAGHAFNDDDQSGYHGESAQDGWQRMLDWFTRFNGR